MLRRAHPSSGRVRRPREALQSHLILKGCGRDDLSRRHGGHTLHGFVFDHLVLSEDDHIRNIINIYPIQLQAGLFLLTTIFLSGYWKSHFDQPRMRCKRGKKLCRQYIFHYGKRCYVFDLIHWFYLHQNDSNYSDSDSRNFTGMVKWSFKLAAY